MNNLLHFVFYIANYIFFFLLHLINLRLLINNKLRNHLVIIGINKSNNSKHTYVSLILFNYSLFYNK